MTKKKSLKPIKDKLFQDLSQLIEQSQKQVAVAANSALTLLFWKIGHRINVDILKQERAPYGKEMIKNVSSLLESKYGRNFTERNVRRMMQFSIEFPDFEIVVPLARQLSWSHFLILIPLKNNEAQTFYAHKAIEENWGKRTLREQIKRKAYERTEIANLKLSTQQTDIQNTFKDPYILDFLRLKNSYLEKDLEQAILRELEEFIMELGKGFAFMERQKRMIIDEDDYYLDLLFYNRRLRRLVAIELKTVKFEAAFKGQMELYLKWLSKYEKQKEEKEPVGLILCSETNKEQIELLELQKDGILVAEFWSTLPPKEELEKKIYQLIQDARERVQQNRIER